MNKDNWISIKDRLPDELEHVAVVITNRKGKLYVRESYRHYDAYDDLIWSEKTAHLGRIILWCYLPKELKR